MIEAGGGGEDGEGGRGGEKEEEEWKEGKEGGRRQGKRKKGKRKQITEYPEHLIKNAKAAHLSAPTFIAPSGRMRD